jgi:cytochrome c-type biogenesis protein
VDAGTLGFAFALGVGTFFSPCAVALVPSYAAYFLATEGKSGFLPGLRFGAWAAAGVTAVFLVAAAALYLLRQAFRIEGASLQQGASVVGVLIGLAFLAIGLLVALGRGPSVTPRLNMVLQRNAKGMFLWGVLFSIGSLGCSLPLALAALALAIGPNGGLLVLGAYAAGLVGLVLLAGPVLGVGGPLIARLLRRGARPVQIAMGVLLAAVGAYVTVYYGLQLAA